MNEKNLEVTILGGGCFWCLDPIFDELTGVEDVVVGYSGDDKEATYQEVCTGLTQHAEVLQVTFDPAVISFEALLKVFFTMHDPPRSIVRERMLGRNTARWCSITMKNKRKQQRE